MSVQPLKPEFLSPTMLLEKAREVSDKMEHAVLVMVNKDGSKIVCSTHVPIALFCYMSKLIEECASCVIHEEFNEGCDE